MNGSKVSVWMADKERRYVEEKSKLAQISFSEYVRNLIKADIAASRHQEINQLRCK